MLASLADALVGLTVQTSFILWKTSQLLGETDSIYATIHRSCIRAVSVCSCLHVMLVTSERLIAIRFTMYYPYMVTKRNIKKTVVSFWIFSFSCEVFRLIKNIARFMNALLALVLISCVVFVAFSYAILYRETLRHYKIIKTQQLPQEEVERFVKENKALKTTVFVVGAVVLCFLPSAFIILSLHVAKLGVANSGVSQPCGPCPWIRTCAMLNSLLNPLIYCWRQKEMRHFIFRFRSPAVAPQNLDGQN